MGNIDDEAKMDDLETMDPEIAVEAIDAVDLSLPYEYLDEVFAMQLLTAITGYHTCVAERRAFRHQGENTKAETLDKQASIYRSQAALIQHEHPNTVVLYKELAALRVVETKKARAKTLGEV